MSKLQSVPDKRQIIAEALLEGSPLKAEALRADLTKHGVGTAAADYEARRAEKDPVAAAAATLARRLAKYDWLLRSLGQLRSSSLPITVPTVHRIEPASFYEEYYAANLPVKLTGLVDHWPAMTRWSLDYLATTVGEALVELQGQRNTAPDYELAKERHRRCLPMRDVVRTIREVGCSNDFYVTAYNDTTNKQSLARLWDDIAPVSILQPTGGRDGFFWLGPAGTLTPFHHDLTNNLLIQVVGRKRIRLVPSWEIGRMANRVHCFSELGPQDMDGPDAPSEVIIDIGPGEALFLPLGWWHYVEALDASISMSFTNFAQSNDFVANYPADARF